MFNRTTIVHAVLLCFAFFGCGVLLAVAQQPAPATARATGRVRTSGGVPVPGAMLRLTDTSSGRAWVSWTDANGRFDLPGLPPGHYRIEVTQIGFEPTVRQFNLSAASSPVDVTLQVATLEAIERPSRLRQLAGTAPAPATSRAAARAASGARAGAERRPLGMPNGGAPGGPAARGPRPGGPGGFPGGFQQVNLNQRQNEDEMNPESEPAAGITQGPLGEASSSDAFLMNGTVGRGFDTSGPVMAGSMAGPAPGNAGMGGPEGAGSNVFGDGAGGQPDGPTGGRGGGRGMMIRRGGGPGGRFRGRGPGRGGVGALWGMQRVLRARANRVRVGFYDRYNNSALNARPYSLTAANPEKIPSWNETFGGVLGGPLYIPHLYDGRDRTFFFANYGLSWARNPVDMFATVPTDAERHGDFSDRSGVQLYDPYSSLSGPRTPWGSSIPSDVPLDPAAVGLLQYIPEPNLPGVAQNFHLQTRVPTASNRLRVHILHSISSRFNAQAVYGIDQSHTHAFENLPAFESNQDSRGQDLMLGLTQNWSRSFLHDSRLFFSRNRVQTLNQFAYLNDIAGSLGITGVSTAPVDFGVPEIRFTNFSALNDPIPSLVRNQTLRYADTSTFLLPTHTVMAGFEVRRMQYNTFSNPTPRGAFTFSGLMTSQLDAGGQPVSGTGFDFADFLLGLPQSTMVRFGTPSTYLRSWAFAGFFNDDWRVRPSFTLEYGIRYEAVTPPTEIYGHLANLDVNPGLTEVAVVLPGQTGPFSGPLPDSLVRGDYNNWAPRVGIAWRPPLGAFSRSHATVVRAGFGIFYNNSIYPQLARSLLNQPPFAEAQTLLTSATQVLTLENGFPAAPPGSVPNTVGVNPNYQVGYAQIWNLSIETALPANTTLDLTYTGTKGSDLDLLFGLSGATNVNPLTSGQSSTIQNAQGFTYDTSGANSIFHALQVRVQHRMSHGLMLNAIYTFGKSIDNASTIGGGTQVIVQNINDLAAERGLSSFDIRHQLRLNYFYEIPLGDRHRLAQKGLSADLFGNWRVSGNITAQSGNPFTARVFDAACQILPGVYSERANQVGDPSLSGGQQSPLQFFNTAAFAVPTGTCAGDAGRNTISGPGMFTWNFQLAKTVRFGRDGNHRVDFRWEVQNLTNTPNFVGLSMVVNSATFGRVVSVSSMRTMGFVTRVNF